MRTARRCEGVHVLAIQDTTVVRSAGGGLYLHPTLAVDAQSGAILGLTHAARKGGGKGPITSKRHPALLHRPSVLTATVLLGDNY